MTDRTIHQLYCTHCTYGTSALHRHTGNVKDQPFEYSTRAGSIEQSTSHHKFQQFEKLIFRGLPLPSDAPADVRRQLSGTTSPWRRLVISGTPGGSVVAHVTYRTTDTSKPPRTGSYFAHILVQETSESSERRWSLADALQMWGSEFWVVQDRDDLPFDLREVSDFKRLPDFGKVINDDALISFLCTPSDGEFHDGSASPMRHELSPSCAIPERWRRRSVEDRRAFFTLLFQSVLKLNLERRERLTLAIEPSVAALLFYGVIRLLPRSGLVDQISISTFEPHNESSSFVLTATDFYDPTTSELPLTGSRAGIAINSYGGKATPQDATSPYVKTVLDLFLDPRKGPANVDRKRDEFAQLVGIGLVTIRDIEQFLSATDLAERFVQFAPANPVSERDVAGLTQHAARQKFRELVFSRLNSFSEDNQFWRGLRESPARTALVMRVIREEPAFEDPTRILERLCDCIPTRDLPQFVEDRQIPSDLRLERLRREVVATGQLPAGCEFLWSQKSSEPNEVPLLERMFRELDFLMLESLCRSVFNEAIAKREVTSKRVLAMISFLAKAARNGDSRKTRFLIQILSDAAFRDDEWDVLLRNPEYRNQLFEVFPVEDRFLRERLIDILEDLPNSGSRFLMRIDILKSGQSRLPPDRREQLANWVNVQSQLELLKEIESTPPGLVERIFPGPRNRKLQEIGNKLGRDSKVMLNDQFECVTMDERLRILQPLAAGSLNSGQLPKAFVQGLRLAVRDPAKAVSRKKKGATVSLVSIAMQFIPFTAVAILVLAGSLAAYRNRNLFILSFSPPKDPANAGTPTHPLAAHSPPSTSVEILEQENNAAAETRQREPKRESRQFDKLDLASNDGSAAHRTDENSTGNEPVPAGQSPVPADHSISPSDVNDRAPTGVQGDVKQTGRQVARFHVAVPHNLPLDTPHTNVNITPHQARSLTFHSANKPKEEFPQLHAVGNGTVTVEVQYVISRQAEPVTLCTFRSTPDGVTVAGRTLETEASVFNIISSLWGTSALKVQISDSEFEFHSFREPKNTDLAWKSDGNKKDAIQFPFDAMLPPWLLPIPENLTQLVVARAKLELPLKGASQTVVQPLRQTAECHWSLPEAFVREELLSQACFAESTNTGLRILFVADPRRQKTLFLEKAKQRQQSDDPIAEPAKVKRILELWRTDLVNVRKEVNEQNWKCDQKEYEHRCDLLGLPKETLTLQGAKDKETTEEAKARDENNEKTRKAFAAKVKPQLVNQIGIELRKVQDATALLETAFKDARLHGELYYLIDGTFDKEAGELSGVAVKLATFGSLRDDIKGPR